MTAGTIAIVALTAAVLLLVFMAGHTAGHKRGRRSRRFDHRDGYLEGVKAEAARWEKVAGVSFERLQSWRTGRAHDPFANLTARTEVLPSAEVLLAQADAALGKQPAPAVPSVAEVDELAAEWKARAGADSHIRTGASAPGWLGAHELSLSPVASYEPPIVADLTGPAAWHYPGEDDIPTITGLIVTPPHRTGPEWLEAQLAAMDSDTDAYLRRMKAEIALSRRGITTGART